MKITKQKYTELLLDHGSIHNFLIYFFSHQFQNPYTHFSVYIEEKKDEIEKQKNRINWDIEREQYLEDGYTEDDIEYEDDEDLINTIIEDYAIELSEEYFSGSRKLIKPIIHYIKELLCL